MKISFKDDAIGEYGIHDGFFNFVATYKDVDYNVQCCAEKLDDLETIENTGYNDGLCGDVNEEMASALGWGNVLEAIEMARDIYLEKKEI